MRAAAEKLREHIEPALRSWKSEMEPTFTQEAQVVHDFMQKEIGGFVKLVGGGWLPDQRSDFIDQAFQELAELPYSVLLPAVRAARRQIFEAKRFVPFIFESVEKKMVRLKNEGEVLLALSHALETKGN